MEQYSEYLFVWLDTPDYAELGRLLFKDEPLEVTLSQAYRQEDGGYALRGNPIKLTLNSIMTYHDGYDKEIPLCLSACVADNHGTVVLGGVKIEGRVQIALYAGDEHAIGVVDTISRYSDGQNNHEPIERKAFVWPKDDYTEELEADRKKFIKLLDTYQRDWIER